MAIYACLGIPPTLTGTFGATGTTNNFISLKTLTERLGYVRNIALRFWNEQLKIVQNSMGFRFPAQVEFDYMYLDDPAAMTNLLLSMADRNIVSDEFVQRHIKAKPDIENRRVVNEEKLRISKNLEKISPYHAIDKDFSLEKIALQTGVVSPSQVGLKLEKKPKGEMSGIQLKERQRKKTAPPEKEKETEEPGRPKNSRDIDTRKKREFKPRNKATVELWAKEAQGIIADILNPGILLHFDKKNMRSLDGGEFEFAENIKFAVLCNLNYLEQVTPELIFAGLQEKLPDGVFQECDNWISNAALDMNRKLSIEEIRNIRSAFYSYYKLR